MDHDGRSELLVVVDGFAYSVDQRATRVRHAFAAHPPFSEDEVAELRRAAVEQGGGRRFRRVRILASHPEGRERAAAELADILPEYARPRRIYTSMWLGDRQRRWRGASIPWRPPHLEQRALAIVNGAPLDEAGSAEPFTWYTAALVALHAESHVLFICPNPWSLLTHIERVDTAEGANRSSGSSTSNNGERSKGWERRPERWRGDVAQLFSWSNYDGFGMKSAEGIAGGNVVAVRAEVDSSTTTFPVDARTGIFYVAA